MPTFISKNGMWEAAQERAFDPKSGEIYQGPDRAAKEVIEANGGPLGQDALRDPQLLQASRNAGFTSVEEYIKNFAPRPEQVKAIEEAQKIVVTHANPTPKEGVTGGTKGGFNDDDTEPIQAMEQKKRGRPRKE
jgi:hypothetical protein